MLNIRISHCTDGVEKTIEISDADIARAFSIPQQREAPPTVRFVDHGDGTVTDSTTGLMWSRDEVPGGEMNHEKALAACAALTLAGHGDWRLPTRAELLTLVDDTRHNPALDTAAFPSCKSSWYWAGTLLASDSSCAWIVYFHNGYAYHRHRGYGAFVRAVRACADARHGHARSR